MGKVIGIDLGTTNACVALMSGGGNPEVVANAEGSRTTPSMVGFTESGEKLVGQIAKRQAVTNPERTVFASKRLIGRKFDCHEVAGFSGVAPFTISAADNGDAWVTVGDRECSPQEISAMILSKMKDTAAEFLGQSIEVFPRGIFIPGQPAGLKLPYHAADPRVRILNVIHGIVIRAALRKLKIEVEMLIVRTTYIKEACGVIANFVTQLAQGDNFTRACRHRHFFPAAI